MAEINYRVVDRRFKVYKELFDKPGKPPHVSFKHYPLRHRETLNLAGLKLTWQLSVFSKQGTIASCSCDCMHTMSDILQIDEKGLNNVIQFSYALFQTRIKTKLKAEGILMNFADSFPISQQDIQMMLQMIQGKQ